jgi:hypothetical protein
MNLLGEANRPRVTVYRKDAAAKGVNFAAVDDKSLLRSSSDQFRTLQMRPESKAVEI